MIVILQPPQCESVCIFDFYMICQFVDLLAYKTLFLENV